MNLDYTRCPFHPQNLNFDEATLFWRLRHGEGIPARAWHKPLDRTKSWEEVKMSLDQKMRKMMYLAKPSSRWHLWLKKFVKAFIQKQALFL